MDSVTYIDFDEAVSIMEKERKETGDIGVFTDDGWGDDPESSIIYTIIKDGDGQNPLAEITKETFDKLISDNLIGPNRLHTYKARTFHYFKES